MEWEEACDLVFAAYDVRAASVTTALRAFDGERFSEDVDWVMPAAMALAKAVIEAYAVYDKAVRVVLG